MAGKTIVSSFERRAVREQGVVRASAERAGPAGCTFRMTAKEPDCRFVVSEVETKEALGSSSGRPERMTSPRPENSAVTRSGHRGSSSDAPGAGPLNAA